MDLKERALISGDIGDHWYYKAKLAAVESICAPLQPRSILDVGAGLGFFSRALLARSTAREAWCVDPGYDFESDEIVAGKPLHQRRKIGNLNADIVLMMDVLEHVSDDLGLIAAYAMKVPPGSFFLFTAPAFMWLWSGHDEYLEHYRRYTLPGLEDKIRQAGLDIELGCYLYGLLLPTVTAARVGRRLLGSNSVSSQMGDHGPVLSWLFDSVCKIEAPFFRRNRIGGVTALVAARKPA
jgi:hypothetical protein